jgi:DNA adenine methylase
MTDHSSPLRYPGGKSSVAPFLAKTVELNALHNGIYIEPFAGGAGAALKLLFSETVSLIYLNDKDRLVYSFWKSILEHTDDFLRALSTCKVNVRTWKKQREITRNPSEYSVLEVGFATFFLNRCNHSGVLNGGPIGGLRQTGDYKISARFNRIELARRIERIHLYRERIRISRADAITFMEKLFLDKNMEPSKCLIYLDPPYLDKAQRLYPLYFRTHDHVRLAKFLASKGEGDFRWIISYDDATPIRRLYTASKRRVIRNYSLHSARVGRELLISSPNCVLPRVFAGPLK